MRNLTSTYREETPTLKVIERMSNDEVNSLNRVVFHHVITNMSVAEFEELFGIEFHELKKNEKDGETEKGQKVYKYGTCWEWKEEQKEGVLIHGLDTTGFLKENEK